MTQGIPSRLNLVIAGAQLTALALILAGAKHAAGFALFAWAIAFAFVMQSAHALLHEASHRKLHPNRRVNDGVGFLLAAIFPTSFTFITAAHLSHHRVNRSDAELFDYIKAHEKPWQKIAGYYALIIGLLWAGQVFFSFGLSVTSRATTKRAYAALDKDGRRFFSFLLRLPRARIRVEVLGIVALWTLAIVLLDLDLRTIAACYGAFIFSWASQQQIYHSRAPRHVVEGSYNLRLPLPLRWLYLNSNYHLTHHRRPKLPWVHLHRVGLMQGSYLSAYARLWLPPEPVARATVYKVETSSAGAALSEIGSAPRSVT